MAENISFVERRKGERRVESMRRKLTYDIYSPERRSHKDRRIEIERRKGGHS